MKMWQEQEQDIFSDTDTSALFLTPRNKLKDRTIIHDFFSKYVVIEHTSFVAKRPKIKVNTV